MKFNPSNPDWINRDRFILSAGNSSMLLYSTLHINGYDVTLDDIKAFRQLHSNCPGHPEYGVSTSVGFAIAEKWLAARYNQPDYKLIDYKIFALAGDGCMMEGISGEAASLAGHLGLDNLVWIYDNNQIAIEGNTNPAFIEDVATRFIAYGAPTKQDTHGGHGSPLGEEEIRATKQFYGWDPDKKFYVPEEVREYRRNIQLRGQTQNRDWNKLFEKYTLEFPDLASEIKTIDRGQMPGGWDCCIPVFESGEKVSGRVASSNVLNAIAEKIPFMIGGSADLTPSALTGLKNSTSFQKNNYGGRNLPVVYIFTHDSIGVGEDGPTHQPIEHIASLRAIPNLEVIRPADANEVSVMWKYIMELILIATGSELNQALEAFEKLKKGGISVRAVSMPNWNLFERQDAFYRESVLSSDVTARISIEAGSTFGWNRFTGLPGLGEAMGMKTFGASGKLNSLLEEFELTSGEIIQKSKSILQ